MNTNTELKVDETGFLDDIEKRVSEIFSAQKSEVEQVLIEKINREKEEAQKRIEAVNQEFAEIRGFLDEHKARMAELQTSEEYLRGEIRGHFERAVNYQKMMENAATLAGEELEKIGGLNRELEKIRVKAEDEYAALKKQLSGYAGITAQLPALSRRSASEVDWNEELAKLQRVRDLLATLRHIEPAAAPPPAPSPAPEPPEIRLTVAEEAEELAASLGLVTVEDDGVRDDLEFAEGQPAPAAIPGDQIDSLVSEAFAEAASDETRELTAEVEAVADAGAPETPEPALETAGIDAEAAAREAEAARAEAAAAAAEAILEALARYRKTEPVNNGIELGFYAGEAATFLDAEAFVTAIAKILDNASQLHAQLTQTGSVKDLFLLKQEILNQQEILRKVFFRIVRFCEKEHGRLPEALSEIISSQGMKELIERLTMANWSDPSDFKPFMSELRAIKRAFETRAAAAPEYLRTVLDQVEGRDN
jgi:hypothetical protein